MRKKLEGNGLWESSRMMLPEHVSRNQASRREASRRKRINLDDQEIEIIDNKLNESFQQRIEVSLRMFHEWEELEVKGIVDSIDLHKQRFMVDGEWFLLVDIEGVNL